MEMQRGAGALLMIAATLTVTMTATGQTAGAQAAFDVVSLKPSAPPDGTGRAVGFSGGPGSKDPIRFSGFNLALGHLLARTYGMQSYQLDPKIWLATERYDLTAKVPEGATREQIPLMLQAMLEERFKLKAHREIRLAPGYELVVSKGGHKLRPSPENPPETGAVTPPMAVDSDGFPILPPGHRRTMTAMTGGRPHMVAVQTTMAAFARLLAGQVDRPVRDATGLKGEYDFRLTWAIVNAPTDTDAPFIFEAIRAQLGLRLAPTKMPLEMLVIDHVEKVPVVN
jgi:uncharacterized protein (TIGR03435 family)